MQETELTNLMYEILSNPERGRLYLKLFDKHVLRLNMSPDELDSARVYGEYPTQFIGRTRYIDLAIITSRRFIPIEVKIGDDYSEQDNQCYDYWREANEYHKQYALSEPPVLYYLTPQGDSPSRESAGDFGFPDMSNFIRSDKIDAVAFCSEGFYWIADCEDNPPKDISQKNNLEHVRREIDKMIKSTDSQRQVEGIMWKFFTAFDNRFDENFRQKYHLKRGGNKRMEIGDCYTYKRYIDRFFGRAFSWPSICLQCTDVKLDDDKELWFRVGCYNGRYSYLDESLAFCAGFMIFSNEIKEGLYKEPEIKRLLNGRNILPQKIVAEYDKKFNGLVGRTDFHDARGNLIYFTDVDRTLRQFRTQEDIAHAVDNIMKEIEKLLRRFIYG
ncbi:MAG: PD-(D/E)XK nuclease family protein [Selenomonadaceae bacterium]|nr:PD-(D/E)XK nuclease family protein [Selenomonadaceae bacterium]